MGSVTKPVRPAHRPVEGPVTKLPVGQVRQSKADLVNVALLGAIAAAGVWLLWREGYLALLRWHFMAYVAVVTLLGLWFGAFELSRRRQLWLALVAGGFGYVTQVVGSDLSGVWQYHGANGTYGFVPTTFVFASTLIYGLVVLVLGPHARRLARRLGVGPSRLPSVAVVAVVFAVLVLTSARYRAGGDAKVAFWLYYSALGLFALLVARRVDLATMLTLVVAAVGVGAVSETLGALSGVWTFTGHPRTPPAYLVLGSWPLEVILHYGLSGMLAGESLLARPGFFEEQPLYEPQREHPMWTGGVRRRVIVAKGPDKRANLDHVLEAGGLYEVLERRARETGKPKAELKVVIKPNLMFMYSEQDRSTFTDPELVEHLVDRLRERGYLDLTVVEAQSAYGNYFKGREVPRVAEIAGYRPEGRYRIVDLTAEMVPHTFKGLLGEHVVGPTWRDADARISFAKNKTHTWAWYTLTIKNIYGALAMQDKIKEYHYAREIYWPTIDMLVDFPVHFGLVDAHTSADGPFGIFADKAPNPTETILGGECLLAVDWVGASKMGLDPLQSRYMQLAVQAFGKPEVEVEGDASVYEPWVNVPKPLIDFWDHAEESHGFTDTVFLMMNREQMSPHFEKRPVARALALASRLVAPLGGLVYKRYERGGRS